MAKKNIKSASHLYTPEKKPLLISPLLIENEGIFTFSLIRFNGKQIDEKKAYGHIIESEIKKLAAELKKAKNPPLCFERALKRINEQIRQSQLWDAFNIKDVDAIIGIMTHNQIFLSGIGNLRALFLHKSTQQRYAIYDLDKRLEENPDKKNPFVTILDGELTPGDIFYLATRTSPQELSQADLQDTLITLPPAGALVRIAQHLKPTTTYGGICFKFEKLKISGKKKINPVTSLKKLGTTKENTASILGDESIDIKNIAEKFATPILKKLKKKTKNRTSKQHRYSKSIIRFISLIAASIVQGGQLIKSLFLKVFKKENKKIVQLSPKKKFMLLGILCLASIFIIGTSINQNRQDQEIANEKIASIITRIQEKKEEAEANLIFDNKEGARTALLEAATLIETLPSDHSFTGEVEELINEINALSLSVNGILKIQTEKLADINTDSTIQTGTIFANSLYLLTNTPELYFYNELNSSIEQVETTKGTIGDILLAAADESTYLLLDTNQQLGSINVNERIIRLLTSGTNNLSSTKGIVLYNQNLYVLSAEDEQIYRMRPQGDGYDAGTPWIISKNTTLLEAQSLTIDGDIYILTSNSILKYTSGIEQTWSPGSIEPAMNAAKQIWTDTISEYLYILEPEEERIIVFDKNGNLIQQYTHSLIQNVLDMIVKEEENSILLITEKEIHRFVPNHLISN